MILRILCVLLLAIPGCAKKKDDLKTEGTNPDSSYVSWSETDSARTESSRLTTDGTATSDEALSRKSPSSATVVSTVDAGYPLLVEVGTPLSSRTSHPGDSFRGALIELVVSGEGHDVAPVGTPVSGRVMEVIGPSAGRSATMRLVLTDLGGRPIQTRLLTLTGTEAATPGPVDSVIGAGATDTTTGVMVATTGGHIDLALGQRVRFALAQPLRLSNPL